VVMGSSHYSAGAPLLLAYFSPRLHHPPRPTLFPYTTLFRSAIAVVGRHPVQRARRRGRIAARRGHTARQRLVGVGVERRSRGGWGGIKTGGDPGRWAIAAAGPCLVRERSSPHDAWCRMPGGA